MTTILQRENGPFRTTVSVGRVSDGTVHLHGTVWLFGMPCVNVTRGVTSDVPFVHHPDAVPVVALAAEVEHVAGRRFAAIMCGQPLSDLDGA